VLLHRTALGCHCLLIAAVLASVLPPATPLRGGIALALALPLLLTLPGLARVRRVTLQRLAVLLVAYIGGYCVEVVARSGSAPVQSVALIAAVLELGLILGLVKRPARSEPAGHE
jgi:hypothetical protein